jgi:hypothetical protein
MLELKQQGVTARTKDKDKKRRLGSRGRGGAAESSGQGMKARKQMEIRKERVRSGDQKADG